MMAKILVLVPPKMKGQLDALRTQGFTIAGFVRSALTRALADLPQKRTR